jgi:pimeloyl-ACP methyl ester carboxylesterase
VTLTMTRKTSGPRSFIEHEGMTGDTRLPLVFLHGVFDSAECWEGVMGLLPSDRRMIAIDARAHGRTPLFEDDFRIASLAADVAHVIDDLVGGPVALIGHSMGGLIAQQTAVGRPDLVSVLVLEDPGWNAGTSTHDGLAAPPMVVSRSAQIATWTDEHLLEQGHLDHPRWHDDEFASWFAAKRQVDLRFTEVRQDWRGYTGLENCSLVTMPTMLVTGDTSLGALVSPADAIRALDLLPPGSRTARLEGCGHDIRKDDRESYAHILTRFLTEAEA